MVSVGMIFTMIIALIMIGAIFAFGLPQIGTILGMGGQAQLQKAVKDLEYTVAEVYNLAEYSSRTTRVSLPSGTKLCFIDVEDPSPRIFTEAQRDLWWNPDPFVITQMINNPNSPYYQSNLWMYTSSEGMGEGYKIPGMAVACTRHPCSFCITGTNELFLENRGLTVEVSLK